MDCWRAANLPRLALHSLSMASKARVTKPPAAPAMAAADLRVAAGRGAGREEMEWLDPRTRDLERDRRRGGLDLGASLTAPRPTSLAPGFQRIGRTICKNFFHTDIIWSEMQLKSSNLPAMSKTILEIRKCSNTVPKLVL
jgi:hypothetical protein